MRRPGLALLTILAVSCGSGEPRLIVAAGTTLVDSGLLDAIVAVYEREHPGLEVSVVGEATRLVLELGRQGAVDLLITHAPDLEAEFIGDGRAAASEVVFTSRFLLVGPEPLRAAVEGVEAAEAFRLIADSEHPFVSRGDGSGTHAAEMLIWLEAGVDPRNEAWYAETGQGMGPTLQIADQRDAATLAEEGVFLVAQDTLTMADLGVSPSGLDNPYRALVVDGAPGQNEATAFLDWLVSAAGRRAIEDANLGLFGGQVYAVED